MKKTYKNPEVKVVSLNTATQLLTQSRVNVGSEYNGTNVLSRRGGSSWDDDDEE